MNHTTHGRLIITPWSRRAITDKQLAQRIPAGHSLDISAHTAKGPYSVRFGKIGGPFVHVPRTWDLAGTINEVLEGK